MASLIRSLLHIVVQLRSMSPATSETTRQPGRYLSPFAPDAPHSSVPKTPIVAANRSAFPGIPGMPPSRRHLLYTNVPFLAPTPHRHRVGLAVMIPAQHLHVIQALMTSSEIGQVMDVDLV